MSGGWLSSLTATTTLLSLVGRFHVPSGRSTTLLRLSLRKPSTVLAIAATALNMWSPPERDEPVTGADQSDGPRGLRSGTR